MIFPLLVQAPALTAVPGTARFAARPARGRVPSMREIRPSADSATAPGELVRRIAAGDAAAEEALVRQFSRGITYLLRRQGLAAEVVEDLHQETFRAVLERLRRRALDDPEALGGYISGTARNLALSERARRRRWSEGPNGETEVAADPAPSPLASVLAAEDVELVRRLLEELPTERDREILERFYVAEEDKDRICADLGLDGLHFNRVLFRARQRFRELLDGFEKRQRLVRFERPGPQPAGTGRGGSP